MNKAQKAYCLKYPERRKASKEKWRKSHLEKWRQYARTFKEKYPEKVVASMRKWYIENSAILNAKKAKRMAARAKALPKWANEFFIEEIYDLAKRRTKMLGFKWHVDHIVPMKSNLVCGLHVENNLRVIPAAENISKLNRHWPDMPQ